MVILDFLTNSSLFGNVIFYGMATILVYVLIFRGRMQEHHPNGSRRTGGAAVNHNITNDNNRANVHRTGLGTNRASSGTTNLASPSSLGKPKVIAAQVPDHVDPSIRDKVQAGGFNILADGLVSFRFTRASKMDQEIPEEEFLATTQKERARVLTRLLQGTPLKRAPSRGSIIVVTVLSSELHCKKLHRVLFLLATFYNLILIISLSGDESDRRKLLSILRTGGSLPASVLPDHRVILASTGAGRVAVVRQLQRVELTVDYDEEVSKTLSRFGHVVKLMRESEDSTGQASSRLSILL